MPRDVHGRPIRPEGSKAAEPMKAGESRDKISNPRMAASAKDPDDAEMLRDHHDRLTRIEEHLGISKPRDGFKEEAQGGSGKSGKDRPTEHQTRQPKPRRQYS